MKPSNWLKTYITPNCLTCGTTTKNKSLICTLCRQTCPLCGMTKSYHAKTCLSCRKGKKRKKGKRREKTNRRSIPTTLTLENGETLETRSMLEASWIRELQHCPFICYECRPIPCIQVGKNGPFVGNYLPDLLLEDSDGNEILCELKPTAEVAMADTRPERALAINPLLRFIVIGGEPRANGGFFVKLVSVEGIVTYENVELRQLMALFGCN